MMVSQKCQYGLRAVLELARRFGDGPVAISQVASSQAIPAKFLGLILYQLKQGGFVESHRGRRGGYVLVRPPGELTVADVIRFMDGPVGPVRCAPPEQAGGCGLYGRCAFAGMWSRAREALTKVYDRTTFEDLIRQAPAAAELGAPGYCI